MWFNFPHYLLNWVVYPTQRWLGHVLQNNCYSKTYMHASTLPHAQIIAHSNEGLMTVKF